VDYVGSNIKNYPTHITINQIFNAFNRYFHHIFNNITYAFSYTSPVFMVKVVFLSSKAKYMKNVHVLTLLIVLLALFNCKN
jgi:hypothetical protein